MRWPKPKTILEQRIRFCARGTLRSAQPHDVSPWTRDGMVDLPAYAAVHNTYPEGEPRAIVFKCPYISHEWEMHTNHWLVEERYVPWGRRTPMEWVRAVLS